MLIVGEYDRFKASPSYGFFKALLELGQLVPFVSSVSDYMNFLTVELSVLV